MNPASHRERRRPYDAFRSMASSSVGSRRKSAARARMIVMVTRIPSAQLTSNPDDANTRKPAERTAVVVNKRMAHRMERGAHGLRRGKPCTPRFQVVAQEMNGVVHDDPEDDGDDHRRRNADVAHEIAPQAEAHEGGYEVRQEADETDPYAPEDENQDERDERHGENRAAEHAVDVALRQVGEHDADARRLACQVRRVGAQPVLRALVQLPAAPGTRRCRLRRPCAWRICRCRCGR